jgi:hypothetical protein
MSAGAGLLHGMISANSIRYATEQDTQTLERLAELDSQPTLSGPVLIAELGGIPAAALSIGDGRVIADPFQGTDHLVANLRMRAGAIRAFEITPSLRERLVAALPSQRGNSVVVYP